MNILVAARHNLLLNVLINFIITLFKNSRLSISSCHSQKVFYCENILVIN